MRILLTTIFMLSLVLGALPQLPAQASAPHDCPCSMPSGASCGGCCPSDTAPTTDDCAASGGAALCGCGPHAGAPEVTAVLIPVHDPTRDVAVGPIRAHVASAAPVSGLRARTPGGDDPPSSLVPPRAALGVWRA